jgi:hypothetical protein
MTERYFSCIDALIRADTKPDTQDVHDLSENECAPGFSIMALCCLLVESIQDFREAAIQAEATSGPCPFPGGGCIKPSSGTNEMFRRFLNLPSFGGAFSDNQVAADFMRGVRNGILHEAETRKWLIWRSLPSEQIVQKLEGRRYRLNRTLFYGAVRSELERYLRNLKEADNNALRVRFMKKMDGICKAT